ncbi:hypothetical protein BELL_1070g00020 [Botrytis elliptica]|uniref:Protein kinase domain-containing protein n=1 Tax=Botrytis elliptica TaxID=278938 RepID=A0A4Z1J433_9HELO|nr:hypothetical protein BELL_1070g00020 [Botrytis elliptica]
MSPALNPRLSRIRSTHEVYRILLSIADTNLWNITWNVSNTIRIKLMKQSIACIQFRHEQGVIHRDIKPGNIGVVEKDPPNFILLDLESATGSQESADHGVGTFICLTSEAIALNDGDSNRKYKISLTINSFAEFLSGVGSTKKYMIRHLRTHAVNNNPKLSKVTRLVKTMMAWNVYSKLTAVEALSDEAFSVA